MICRLSLLLLFFFSMAFSAVAQDLKAERILHQEMLKAVRKDVEKQYYDPRLNGVDIKANFKQASKLIDKAKTSEEMTDIISRFLFQFNDSHVYFLPPRKTVSVDYGWELRLFDNKAFVTAIDEDSDAFKKGVRIGDQIYMLEGFIPRRHDFHLLRHHFEVLRPQRSLNIFLIKPSGNKYKLKIEAEIMRDHVFMPTTRELDMEAEKEYADSTRLSYYQDIKGLTVLKMPSFMLSPRRIDKMMDRVKGDSLILDLRENGGGLFASLGKLVSNFFSEEVTICFVKNRVGTERYISKPRSNKVFKGKLVVLTGNDSASAAELFARIVQLEKRGLVIGDQTAGAVMQSKTFMHTFGLDSLIPYGVSVTVGDVIMKDRQRLEKIGVTPDEKIIPTAADLVSDRDPTLSRAAELLGYQISPQAAGALFND